MSTEIAPDEVAARAVAKRFMTAVFALRSHVATRSILNYPPGLNTNQFKMLHLVFHRPGISQTTVAERLGVTTASISTSVREMEAQGLIERHPNPDDARVLLLKLAPAGEELFERVFDSFIDTCADLLDVLDVEEREALVEQFEHVLTANNINLDNTKLNYADKFQTMKESPYPVSC